MLLSRLTRVASIALLAVPLAFAAVGCGPKNEAKTANVQPGSMPEGAEWQGVYYSQLYGYLHLVEDGNTVSGAWRTTAGDSFGQLNGQVEGDVLKYEWSERRIGAVGADANRKGKGYFRYTAPKAGEAHELQGEWGLGEDSAGNEWKAVKQKNMQPNPDSVKPDEVEGRVTGGGWDDEGGADGGGDEKSEEGDGGGLE